MRGEIFRQHYPMYRQATGSLQGFAVSCVNLSFANFALIEFALHVDLGLHAGLQES